MKRYSAFLLAILALGAVGYLVFPYLRTSQEPVPPQSFTGGTVTPAEITESTETYAIDVTYPQFGISAIDADIKAKIDAAVTEFKAIPPNPPESATPQNEFNGTFGDVYVGPDVVSAELILSQYTGGAHPMTIISGVNYDTATGEQLLQEDAFQMIGKTLEQVSAEATAKLKVTLGDTMFEEGASANPENFSSFLVTEDEVVFIFQPYQVASYAQGVQEVSFKRVR